MEDFDLLFLVEGMMCQKNCGTTVQNAISDLSFVKQAVVSYDQKSALVKLSNYDQVDSYVHQIIDAIESVGYDASLTTNKVATPTANPTEENISPSRTTSNLSDSSFQAFDQAHPDISITIENMLGANDVRRVEDILNSSDGVFNVKINSETKVVSIWGFADENELVKSLIIKGFQAMNTEQYQEKLREERSNKMTSSERSNNNQFAKKVYTLNFTTLPFQQKQKKIESLTSALKQLNQEITDLDATVNPRHLSIATVDTQYDEDTKIFKISFPSDYLISRSGKVSGRKTVEGKIKEILEELQILLYLAVEGDSQGTATTKKEFVYKIRGMSCSACASKIEREVSKLPGIVQTTVSVMTHQGKATIDEKIANSVGPRDILLAINELGYEATLADTSAAHSSSTMEAYEEELLQWRQLLIISCIFGIPVLIFHFCAHIFAPLMMVMEKPSPGVCHGSIPIGQSLMLILNFPMLVMVGYKYYRAAIVGAIHGSYGMDFLVMTGTLITFTYSMIQLCLACWNSQATEHVFFETTGMLLLFVTIGKYIEAYAKGKSASSIAELLKLQPREASLVTGDSAKRLMESFQTFVPPSILDLADQSTQSSIPPVLIHDEDIQSVSIDLVQKGDIVKILPGERIPTDGKVIAGHSYVDEAMITGESIPVHKVMGDGLFGSTVNQSHTIYMSVTSYGSDSALAQIVRLVETAQMNKAPVQDYADRLAGIFTPIILMIALCTFIIWLSLAYAKIVPESWFADEYNDPILFALLFSISVVVISCPCALGLATPTAIMVGTTVGAQNGILIKGGSAFETAHKVNTIVFDKTGTLTKGKPSVTDIIPIHSEANTSPEEMRNRILLYAATAEQDSDHPLAKAIQQHAQRLQIQPLPLSSNNAIKAYVGNGVTCTLSEGGGGEKVHLGNRKFMKFLEIPLSTIAESEMWNLEIQGKTAICIALNQTILGVIGIADTPKEEADTVIKLLKGMGMDIWMFTGDNATTAEALANSLEISLDRVLSSMLPEDKVNKVKELQSQGNIVAMIGDGINDSPALVQAHLGVAIGAGTQIAMESAHMILIRSNLKDLIVAFDLAKVVFRRIQWNFLWAMIYNLISVPFAAGIWFPWTKMLLPPHYAGLAMALSSISVVISSMLLKRYRRPESLQEFSTDDEVAFDSSVNRSDSFSDEEEGEEGSPSHRQYRRILAAGKQKKAKKGDKRSCCTSCVDIVCCGSCGTALCTCVGCCGAGQRGGSSSSLFSRGTGKGGNDGYNQLPVNEQEAEEFLGFELTKMQTNSSSFGKKSNFKFNEELEDFTV